uniref:Uncharacterized protein n=1 Tax=Globisporangium ultimum (strain ATCC 200006 / CBS 805.95 / DAOM BR144) TaxID=431595 RepID=K3WEY9_GLOUD
MKLVTEEMGIVHEPSRDDGRHDTAKRSDAF